MATQIRTPNWVRRLAAATMALGLAGGSVQAQSGDCPVCPEMVRIPPGSFLMGAAPGEHDREGVSRHIRNVELPQHRVTIRSAFSLGKYEVTRAEFAAFVRATGYQTARDWRNPTDLVQSDQETVVKVSWQDARAYAAWLSGVTGKHYRLPTEAEWEYAARGGSATVRYWGDNAGDACKYENVGDDDFGCSDGYKDRQTSPVGSFLANGFGLHDMLGNVSEWTEDCWNEGYGGAPADGSAWRRGDCDNRVFRGGSYASDPEVVRAAVRSPWSPELTSLDLGFRVARTD